MKNQEKQIKETLEFIRTQDFSISADEYLQKIALFLAHLLDVEYVLINKYSIQTPTITETVVVCNKESIIENFSYELANTPCENVINREICIYPSNIQAFFPKDQLLTQMNVESYVGTPLWSSEGKPIGLIALLDGKPIMDVESIKVILQIVAIKVEKILEKTLYNSILKSQIEKLEAEKLERIESQERYKGLSEASFEAIFMSENGMAVEQNTAAQKMFGYTNEEVIGMKATAIIAPKDHKLVLQKIQEGCKDQYEVTAVRKDGTTFPAGVRGKMTQYKGRKVRISTFNDISVHKKLEILLKKSEEQFKKLANLTFEGIIIHHNGIAVDVNQSFEKMFGYKRKEIIGKDIVHLLYPKKYHKIIKENRKKKKGLPIEIEGIKKEGTIFSIEIEGRDYLTEDNKVFRVGAVRNLTEKNKTQAQTKKLTTAVEQSANSIIITDAEANIEYVNPKFTKITGFTLEEAIGQNPRILKSGNQPKEYYATMWKTMMAGKTWHGEFQNKSKSGKLFWEQVTISSIKNEEGEIINYLAIKEDITKRKNAELKLNKAFETIKINETYLTTILKTTNEGFWVINTEAKTLEVNPEMCKILGFNEIEIIGKSIFDFVDNENAEIFKEQIKKRASGESSTYQIALLNKNGEKTTCLFKTSPIYNNKKVIIGSFAMVTDVSELKNAYELSENQNQELRKLSVELADKNELLQESTSRFKQLFELSPVSIWEQDYSEAIQLLIKKKGQVKDLKNYLDKNHDFVLDCIHSVKIVNVNKATLNLIGVKNKEELLVQVRKSLNTEDIEVLKKELLVVASTDKYELQEITKFIKTDGTEINTILKLVKLNNKGKAIVTLNDITALKKIEQELQNAKEEAETKNKELNKLSKKLSKEHDLLLKSNDRFKNLFNESPVSIWEQDFSEVIQLLNNKKAEGLNIVTYLNENPEFVQECISKIKVLNVNKITLELIGVKSKKELISHIRKTNNRKAIEVLKNEIASIAKGNKEFRDETEFVRTNGHILTAIIKSTINKETGKGIASVIDITALKKIQHEHEIAKEHAEESDRLKTEFLNNMSHEIRTPLNGILGFSQMLDDPDLDPIKRNNFVKIIQSSGNQLVHIIDDILEISRLGTKQVTVLNEEVCLNDVLLELFSIFDAKAKENKTPLYLKKPLSDKQSTILSDQSKLIKIIGNLLENALKFTNEGCIEFGYNIKTANERAMLEIYVKDTGVGIKPEKHQQIFERFSQAEKELSKKTGGLGLGLSIAKENAELLGGEITVASEMMKGATFTITLPFKPVYPFDETEENQHKLAILIAEDEEVNFMYLETILVDIMKLNCRIFHAKNGLEVIKIFKNNPTIDIILMDLKMPVLNGFEATKHLREFNATVPIIAQTAYSTAADRKEALLAGCNEFISKPIERKELALVLESYLPKDIK